LHLLPYSMSTKALNSTSPITSAIPPVGHNASPPIALKKNHSIETEDNEEANKSEEHSDSDSSDSPTTNQTKQIIPNLDPSNFDQPHPLQHPWTLWYDGPKGRKTQVSWRDHLKKNTNLRFCRRFLEIVEQFETGLFIKRYEQFSHDERRYRTHVGRSTK